MNRKNLAIWFVGASYIWLSASVLVAGAFYPGYNHISQFMSELGAVGAPHDALMNMAGFFGTEILFVAGLVLALSLMPKTKTNIIGLLFLFGYPIAVSVSAWAPCDAFCRPEEPSVSHIIHMTSALFGYLCAVIGLSILAQQSCQSNTSTLLRMSSYALAPILIVAFGSMTPDNAYAGAIQRLAETTLYGWTIWWMTTLPINDQARSA